MYYFVPACGSIRRAYPCPAASCHIAQLLFKKFLMSNRNSFTVTKYFGSNATITESSCILREGHKFLRNLHCRFVLCSNGQVYGGDFAKFCGFLRIINFTANLISKPATQNAIVLLY